VVIFICLKKENLDIILDIKKNMNNGRSFEERWYFCENQVIQLNNEWVQAFIDGEGNFQFEITNTINKGKSYVIYRPYFIYKSK